MRGDKKKLINRDIQEYIINLEKANLKFMSNLKFMFLVRETLL